MAQRRDLRASVARYLAAKPEGVASANELIATFWPENTYESAAHALSTTINRLRTDGYRIETFRGYRIRKE